MDHLTLLAHLGNKSRSAQRRMVGHDLREGSRVIPFSNRTWTVRPVALGRVEAVPQLAHPALTIGHVKARPHDRGKPDQSPDRIE